MDKFKRPIIVILGAPNDEYGNLSSISVGRCDVARDVFGRFEGAKILPTGGFGRHFNTTDHPHWFYVSNYLIERGVPREYIETGIDSANTIEDAQMSAIHPAVLQASAVMVVTSDFHIPRATFVFGSVFHRPLVWWPAKYMAGDGEALPDIAHEEAALKRMINLSIT